jgi:tetratricopeptide (TPR) repeat protein
MSDPGWPRLIRFSDTLTLFAKVAAQCLMVVVIAGGIVYFIHLQCVRSYRVLIVNVPTLVANHGVSADVARHLLAQRLSHLQDLSNTTIDHRFQADRPKLDFTIPQTSLSFENFVSWTQDALGHNDTLVAIDVVEVGDSLEMTPRVVDEKGSVQYLQRRSGKDFNELLDQAAGDILRWLSPLVSGTAALAVAKDHCQRSSVDCKLALYNEAIADLQPVTYDRHREVFHRAFISLADLYAYNQEYGAAIAYLDALIARVGQDNRSFEPISDRDVLDAYLMRGVDYTAQGNHEAAMRDFQHVITYASAPPVVHNYDCNALQSYAYENVAKDLVARHTEADKVAFIAGFKSAIAPYLQSLRFCPHNRSAKAGLGYAYFVTDQFEEANKTLSELLREDGSWAMAHKDLGRSMREWALQGIRKSDPDALPKNCKLFADAIEELKLAVQWGTINESHEDTAQAYLDLGKTLRTCGDGVGAHEALIKSLEEKPNYDWAKAELQSLDTEIAAAKK